MVNCHNDMSDADEKFLEWVERRFGRAIRLECAEHLKPAGTFEQRLETLNIVLSKHPRQRCDASLAIA